MSLGFKVRGRVQEGAKRGRKLGFPTANIAVASDINPLEKGVYACWIWLDIDKYYKGVVNIGVRPTFGEEKLVYEAHVFDFDGNLYGKEIELELVKYLRHELSFCTIEALKDQINTDILTAKTLLADIKPNLK